MDERELEQAVRAGLERRAAETDVTAPVVARARAEVGRRRRARWGAGAAAAAVVMVVGGVAVATRDGGDEAKEPPVVDDSSTTDPARTGEWRTEYWGRVAVDVPASWGYGGAPLPNDPLTVCGPGAAPGYVGRPVVLTDVCTSLRSGWQPTAPYVWVGADVEPGTYEWDNGYVQETVEVAGETVTVGSDDAALRDEILATVRTGDEPVCATRYAHVPQARTAVIAGAAARPYAWVCAYRRTEDAFTLAYAREVDAQEADQALAAQRQAPDQQVDCDYEPLEFVVVTKVVPGDRATSTVYETGCAGGTAHLPTGETKEMVDAGVDPWADRGIPSVLSYFTGPQG